MKADGRKTRLNIQRRLFVELLEDRLPLSAETLLVNFQPNDAAVPNRYLVDSGFTYGDRGNGFFYGWSSNHTDVARESANNADLRLDTLVPFHQFQAWEFQLSDGLYDVTVSIGDPVNASTHTVFVEGVNYWNAEPLGANEFLYVTQQITVSDGRLTLDQANAAEQATRINYVHIQGLAPAGNGSPLAPVITEPAEGTQGLNPTDVHLEAAAYFDPDGDPHVSSDWEIWSTGSGAQRVWFTLGIAGAERRHTHLGDGFFENSHAGRVDLLPNTDYELRVRFRDEVGSVSSNSTRLFQTGAASTTFPLSIEDVADPPAPTWVEVAGGVIELPSVGSILSPADTILAIDTDGESDYPGGEPPQNAIDGDLDKYLNFGERNSGFIVTPASGSSVIESFQITTADDFEVRDPATWQLYGTNDPITSTDNSTGQQENWTLIDSGSVALPAARNTPGPVVAVTNTTTYASYRMIFPSVKNFILANAMQLAEIQFFGQLSSAPLLSPVDSILAVDTDGNSDYPVDESPRNVIDQSLDKYLNFGEVNAGFIVTPTAGSTIVDGFQITTANDEEPRDPTSWQLYGTNDIITSADNSTGLQENWALIDSGPVSLPAARNTLGPRVDVSNNTAYTSYRMIFTGVKNEGAANSMQLAEVQLFGESGITAKPSSLRVESAAGELLLEIEGTGLPGNLVTNPAALDEHVDVRVVISGGSTGLNLDPSDLTLTDDIGRQHVIALPNLLIAPCTEIYLWVAIDGATYYGDASQTVPDFSFLARRPDLISNFIALQPNFVVEVVAEGLQLPVNVAFVPAPGPDPGDVAFYVTELYGTVKVVTNDGTVSDYATDLLNFNPTGNFPGSGEQGLTGLVVDPATGDVFVSRVTDTDGQPEGPHHPQVLRFTSNDGGLTAATETVILDMVGESQGQSHQISNLSIGPDGKLYVHNGDGFDASTALNMDSYRGKILRMNLDGSLPTDNPFYDAANGINSRDYIFAFGFRNPFGGAWRASDGQHYEVENGPSTDRFAQVVAGGNYEWDGSNASMFTNAIYNWDPAHAPVNITFAQRETFNGSGFPEEKMDRAFVSESGPTYAEGPQALGKRIVEFELDAAGQVVSGPNTLVEYVGPGRATVVGLTAGPDGLYFTDLYKDLSAQSPIDPGARVLRVRHLSSDPDGDFNNDGIYDCTDVDQLVAEIVGGTNAAAFDLTGEGLVDLADLESWLAEAGDANLGSGNVYLGGDANLDGTVDGADFLVWNTNKFTSTAAWCSGDFNADGAIDGADFLIWNSHKFQSSVVPNSGRLNPVNGESQPDPASRDPLDFQREDPQTARPYSFVPSHIPPRLADEWSARHDKSPDRDALRNVQHLTFLRAREELGMQQTASKPSPRPWKS